MLFEAFLKSFREMPLEEFKKIQDLDFCEKRWGNSNLWIFIEAMEKEFQMMSKLQKNHYNSSDRTIFLIFRLSSFQFFLIKLCFWNVPALWSLKTAFPLYLGRMSGYVFEWAQRYKRWFKVIEIEKTSVVKYKVHWQFQNTFETR